MALVTALFADVVGSSGMAREMSLDQYVETMNDCFKMMVDTMSIKLPVAGKEDAE